MADVFIGADVGDSLPVELTVDTSTTSKTVELRIAVAASPAATRVAALEAVEAIKTYLQQVPTWPA